MVPTPKNDPGVCVLEVVTTPKLSVAVGSVQDTVVPVLPVVVVAVTSLMQLTTGAVLSTEREWNMCYKSELYLPFIKTYTELKKKLIKLW